MVIHKILVVRLSSIGDIVLTTPVVRCLNQQLHRSEIHFLTKPQFAGILHPNPYITKVHLWQDSIGQTVQSLKTENFTHLIDLHNNQRTLLLKWKLGIPARSFNKLNFQKWLIVNTKYNILPPLHIVDRYMETVSFLNVQNDGKGLDFFIRPNDEVDIPTHFPMIGSSPFVAMAIGAAHATKCLPFHKLLVICELIKLPIILLGGVNDVEIGQKLSLKLPKQVVNACGQLSLQQSASVIKQAVKIITPDTGLMHIAAAFNKPIISIWGNTIPEFGMYPYLPKQNPANYVMAEVKGLPCRPCSKIGFDTCPKKHFRCMELIDENFVADWVNE
jgi:ADP-heptose:LPS heptosyltransferase